MKANIASISAFQRITTFLLLIMLGGNFLLPVSWGKQFDSFWHAHIILGPIFPGWENHHGEATPPLK
ncbi:MAG: hypothetical protein ACE5FQ_16195, partial [Thiogranum sp.]